MNLASGQPEQGLQLEHVKREIRAPFFERRARLGEPPSEELFALLTGEHVLPTGEAARAFGGGGGRGGVAPGGFALEPPTLAKGILVDCEVRSVEDWGCKVVLNGSGLRAEIRAEHLVRHGGQREMGAEPSQLVAPGEVICAAIESIEPGRDAGDFRIKARA